ncbi:PLP-dependent aminotransferase family protein [Actinoplanes sp. L3-i22]|uniref:aminotransferase-like domain-containing protein n=1 Tax=Actinoplanes sp. L3-i22 TaxID=2836373 RepID=UPI001C77F320|nr:PLP-dependent aminotransferase family protein [Actinoplanes sp. L3-i22]BCY14193.1 aminotransferase [Actinoplanes sp. L3-i22]
MTGQRLTDLHGSLRDPLLGSIGFLNEVMGRYPEAISFAPGAPHPEFYDDVDVAGHLDRYLRHLETDRGLAPDAARRRLFEYGPSRGLINDLVADLLRRDAGIHTLPEALVITVGAQEAMLLTLRALYTPGDDLLAVADPSFVGILGAARMLDIPVVGIEETADGPDLDALAKACTAGRRIRAFYVAPDFANPGGGRMSVASRHRLLELAEEHDFLVIEDNTYGFTAAPGQERPVLKALDRSRRVVHIGTFAKVCFPGARVGFVVADQRVAAHPSGGDRLLADDLAALKSVVTVNTAPIAQAVIGGILLANGGSLAVPARRRAVRYQQNLDHLLRALDTWLGPSPRAGVRWNRPDGGFFVRVHLPVPVTLALLERSAAEFGVLWTPMAQFYPTGAGDRQLRLSCSYLDAEQIDEGAARLAAFLQEGL